MYNRWRPGSRRDRRRNRGSSRRTGSEGADRSFLIVAGLFVLALILVFVAFFYVVYSNV